MQIQCLHYQIQCSVGILFIKKQEKEIHRPILKILFCMLFCFWDKLSPSAQCHHIWRILHQNKEKYPHVIVIHGCWTFYKLTTKNKDICCVHDDMTCRYDHPWFTLRRYPPAWIFYHILWEQQSWGRFSEPAEEPDTPKCINKSRTF